MITGMDYVSKGEDLHGLVNNNWEMVILRDPLIKDGTKTKVQHLDFCSVYTFLADYFCILSDKVSNLKA